MAGEVSYKFWWPPDITSDAHDIARPLIERAASEYPQLVQVDANALADAVVAVTQLQAGARYEAVTLDMFALERNVLVAAIFLDSETAEFRGVRATARVESHELTLADVPLADCAGRFFESLMEGRGYGKANRWMGRAELLLVEIDKLLQQRDRLLAKLEVAYADLDVANTRLAQLQAAYDQLRSERYEMKRWTTPSMLVAIATLIVTVIGVLPRDAGQAHDSIDVQLDAAVVAAQQLIQDCGDTTIHVEVQAPTPPPPNIPETK